MTSPDGMRDRARALGIGLAVVVAYVVAAKFGFRLAFVAEQVTTVWAPTGIAQAALLLWGVRLWPAVWVGAFIANAGTAMPLWVAAGVATGNTLEALAATWALRRLPGFDATLQRIRDAGAFLAIAAVGSTLISATVGVTLLCASGTQSWSRFAVLWSDWWLGDALGALIVAPVLLTWARRPRGSWKEWRQAAILVAGTALVTQAAVGHLIGPGIGHHPVEYVIFPFVIGAAVRLAQPTTALVVLVASAITIWNTAGGAEAGPEGHRSLILLQAFMGVLAGIGLMLAAAIAEQRANDRRRAAALGVGEVLSSAPGESQAAPAILETIGRHLGLQAAAFWLVDREANRFRCLAVWSLERGGAKAVQEPPFESGVGLPGRVGATRAAVWVADVRRDPQVVPFSHVGDAAVLGAFAFPIHLGDDVLGVIECFTRSVMTRDADLLRTMTALGYQIGQFIGRKRLEAATAEAQRRTRAILDTALDGIIGLDHAGAITEFNTAAERMFGHRKVDVFGRPAAELLIPARLHETFHEGLAHALAGGAAAFVDRRMETEGCHADGHEFPVEVAIARVSDDDPPRFTAFVRDLTARVEAERERDELLQRELSARREAEAANRAKDEFLATLSHELRTPLNAIVGWTRMLLDGTMDERSTQRALQVIDRNAHLQAKLVGDILDVSRIITGGLRIQPRPVDLGAVIAAALDVVRPAAEAKNVRLRSRIEPSARQTEGDPQRLQQVIWNLLANAVKFTDPGGAIDVELLDGRDSVSVRVQDDGSGIEPAFLAHVFERFRQADGSVTRLHGGLGLGLAIVRHLVELHGGTVAAESPGPGRGSTFTVSLPKREVTRPQETLMPVAATAIAGVAPLVDPSSPFAVSE